MQSSVIPIINFPDYSPKTVSVPWANALQGALQGYTKMQDIQKQNLENQNQQYLNLINQVKAQNAPAMGTAELAKAQAEPGLVAAQTAYQTALAQGKPHENALQDAQAAKANVDTKNLLIANKYAKQKQQADIAETQARTNYYNMGGGRQAADQQKLNSFNRQLQVDNPKNPNESDSDYFNRINRISSGYLAGDQTLPPLSGQASQLLTDVQGTKATAAVKNQATQLDILSNDLKGFDIDALKSFAGPQGRMKLAYAKANMALHPDDPNIDPMARRFLTSVNQTIAIMDQLRKAYGTSVVPNYVYATMGKLSNPTSDIWNDPTQVGLNFNSMVDTVNKNRDLLMNKARHGVTAGNTAYNIPTSSPSNIVKYKRVNGRLIKE